MDARHAVMHYKYKGDRVDEVLRSIVLNHVSRLESENKRLREALHEIHENTRFAEVVTIRLKDVHEFARQALEGD